MAYSRPIASQPVAVTSAVLGYEAVSHSGWLIDVNTAETDRSRYAQQSFISTNEWAVERPLLAPHVSRGKLESVACTKRITLDQGFSQAA